jgi:hypothetical protein
MKTYQLLLATLLFALTAVPDTLAQQKATPVAAPTAAPAAVAKPAAEEESASVPNKPSEQGIKIHGHWVLQVINADGTKGERREFDNSLTTEQTPPTSMTGDQVLGMLLSGNAVPSDPIVVLGNNTTAGIDPGSQCLPLQNNNGYGVNLGSIACVGVGTGTDIMQVSNSTYQLGLTTTLSFTPTVKWVLAGTVAMIQGQTTVGTVQTLMPLCIPHFLGSGRTSNSVAMTGTLTTKGEDIGPASCAYNTYATASQAVSGTGNADFPAYGTLTSTLVTPALTGLTTGQLIQVTVTISFS